MRLWTTIVLYTTLFTLLSIGCRPQPVEPKLIFNIPGPDIPKYHKEWELYEYYFLTEVSPTEASLRLQRLGYRFLTPEEEPLAKTYVLENCRLVALSLGLFYLDHPMIVLIKSEKTKSMQIMGFDQGMGPRPIRKFYEHAKLGEEYGWLVMREKPINH